jgi:hypothetical protein
MKLQINEHPIDRGIRIVLTGIVGFCPLYAILRLSTAPARR